MYSKELFCKTILTYILLFFIENKNIFQWYLTKINVLLRDCPKKDKFFDGKCPKIDRFLNESGELKLTTIAIIEQKWEREIKFHFSSLSFVIRM